MSRRGLAWTAELARIRADRAVRPAVREERLRVTAGLRCGANLSAWRGRSGRRYVVLVHPIADAARVDPVEAVVIAVARDAAGIARALGAVQGAPRWPLAEWAPAGTRELHVHRLAETVAAREAIVEDLGDAD